MQQLCSSWRQLFTSPRDVESVEVEVVENDLEARRSICSTFAAVRASRPTGKRSASRSPLRRGRPSMLHSGALEVHEDRVSRGLRYAALERSSPPRHRRLRDGRQAAGHWRDSDPLPKPDEGRRRRGRPRRASVRCDTSTKRSTGWLALGEVVLAHLTSRKASTTTTSTSSTSTPTRPRRGPRQVSGDAKRTLRASTPTKRSARHRRGPRRPGRRARHRRPGRRSVNGSEHPALLVVTLPTYRRCQFLRVSEVCTQVARVRLRVLCQ